MGRRGIDLGAARRLVIDGRRLTAGRTGVGRYLEILLLNWAESGWPLDRTVLVVPDADGLSRVAGLDGLEVEVVGRGWPGLIWERFGLGRTLRAGDCLFAPTNLIPGSWRGPTALVIFDTMLESAPGGFPASVRWRFRARYRSAARRATRIIVPSDSTGRDVALHFGISPDRVRTIYPSVGPEFRPRSADDPLVVEARRSVGIGDEPFFLFVGKRSARRNVECLLAAFSDARRIGGRMDSTRGPDPAPREIDGPTVPSDLVFVGPDGGTSLPPDLPGIVNAGHVPDRVLLGLYSAATACLYPSDYEGFGLPVLEAMASGCPVICVRAGALLESGGEAALSVDRVDAESLVAAMRLISTGPEVRDEYVRLGLLRADRFRGPRFAADVRDEIRAAASGPALD